MVQAPHQVIGSLLTSLATRDLYNAFVNNPITNMPGYEKKRAMRKGKKPQAQSYKMTSYKKKSNTGYTPSSFRTTKTFEPDDVDRWSETNGINQQTLSKYAVLFPPARVGLSDLNFTYENGLREGPRIFVKGIRFWADFQALRPYDMELHVVLLQKTAVGNTITNLENDFFTNHIVGEEQSTNFVSTTTSLREDQRYLKINSDKYRVLMHQIRELGPSRIEEEALTKDWNVPNKQSNKFIKMDKYFKINEVFEFENNTQGVPERPLVFCCWVCPRNEATRAAISTGNALSFTTRHQVYYEEMK